MDDPFPVEGREVGVRVWGGSPVRKGCGWCLLRAELTGVCCCCEGDEFTTEKAGGASMAPQLPLGLSLLLAVFLLSGLLELWVGCC